MEIIIWINGEKHRITVEQNIIRNMIMSQISKMFEIGTNDKIEYSIEPYKRLNVGFDHESDCAVHNEPAYPKGKCDCYKEIN